MGAPGSHQRTPGFPVRLLALANLMRLSLMKAAQAALGASPCRKSGPWDEKDGEALQLFFAKSNQQKQSKNIIFGPGTLMRTWGTRPVPTGFC
jgi:hypothetical protein